jgi:hypothetical protein
MTRRIHVAHTDKLVLLQGIETNSTTKACSHLVPKVSRHLQPSLCRVLMEQNILPAAQNIGMHVSEKIFGKVYRDRNLRQQ